MRAGLAPTKYAGVTSIPPDQLSADRGYVTDTSLQTMPYCDRFALVSVGTA